jgi:3-dehydroquinate synthase
VPRIIVRHALGRYPVIIEPGALTDLAGLVAAVAPNHRPIIITDRNVAAAVPLRPRWPRLVVPPGEGSKTRSRWARLTDRLLALGLGRDSVIVAVGGGVVGDLAGFVAATYLRGIPVVLVPTSLLAMVDASVGGKTGVNSPKGKNLIGAFHPPAAVVIDPAVLGTLPDRHFRAGLVEATKHGLVASPRYARWLERHREAVIGRDPAVVARLVAGSVAIKARIVTLDEREGGRRAVLNAGHTVGHAIEQASGYRIGHGDAVALGLVAEATLAARLGRIGPDRPAALAEWFASLGVPLRWPAASDARLMALMARDKKTVAGRLRLALLDRGRPVAGRRAGWVVACSPVSVRQALAATRSVLEATRSAFAATRSGGRGTAIHRLSTSRRDPTAWPPIG